MLHAQLRKSRDALIWKVEGLDEAERRRPMTPTGTNLIGLVKHMTWIEGWYLCEFFGRERPRLEWEWELDADWGHHSDMYAKPEETTDELIAAYRATLRRSRSDHRGTRPRRDREALVGQARLVAGDAADRPRRHHPSRGPQRHLRELIDGATGDRDSPSGFYGAADERVPDQVPGACAG